MDIKKLRIGNWVQVGSPFKITNVQANGIINGIRPDGSDVNTINEIIEGIKLNESILLNCGFVKNHRGNYIKWFIEGVEGLVINQIENQSYIYAGGDLCKVKHISYVHQLQNIISLLIDEDIDILLCNQTFTMEKNKLQTNSRITLFDSYNDFNVGDKIKYVCKHFNNGQFEKYINQIYTLKEIRYVLSEVWFLTEECGNTSFYPSSFIKILD